MIELRKSGKTLDEIALELGQGKSTVRYILNREDALEREGPAYATCAECGRVFETQLVKRYKYCSEECASEVKSRSIVACQKARSEKTPRTTITLLAECRNGTTVIRAANRLFSDKPAIAEAMNNLVSSGLLSKVGAVYTATERGLDILSRRT